MWQGDFTPKPAAETREKLLAQRAELVKQITALKAKPLPVGDKEQMQRFRLLDLKELAAKIVKIDTKLGRNAGVKMLRV
jgi:chorismate mutase